MFPPLAGREPIGREMSPICPISSTNLPNGRTDEEERATDVSGVTLGGRKDGGQIRQG